jgi:hypothetical protein
MEPIRVAQSFICPHDGRPVTCQVCLDPTTGEIVGVERCTGLTRWVARTCDTACIDLLARGWSLDSDGDG